MSEIFISHAQEDTPVAMQVALALERGGYRTWSYEVDSVPGPSYLIQTGESVERADAVLLIISAASLGSQQVTREVVRGLECDKPFVPLLRDVTHVEFQARQPEWRSAVGAATSIQIPSEGVQSIFPRIVAGLEALGLERGPKSDRIRLRTISEVLEGSLAGAAAVARAETTSETDLPARERRQPLDAEKALNGRRSWRVAGAALGLGVLAAGVWGLQGRTETGVDPASFIEEAGPGRVLDISLQRDRLTVLHDLEGHNIAVTPRWDREGNEFDLFYGTGMELHAQRVSGGGTIGRASFNYAFWDPRFQQAVLVYRDSVYSVRCGDQVMGFAPAERSLSEAVLSSGVFQTPLWKHEAYALARDDDARYVYVDRSLQDTASFRLFVGPAGRMRRIAIERAASDPTGTVLATEDGALRVAVAGGEVSGIEWLGNDDAPDLVALDVWSNLNLIYGDGLGVYPATLGTPCDLVK